MILRPSNYREHSNRPDILSLRFILPTCNYFRTICSYFINVTSRTKVIQTHLFNSIIKRWIPFNVPFGLYMWGIKFLCTRIYMLDTRNRFQKHETAACAGINSGFKGQVWNLNLYLIWFEQVCTWATKLHKKNSDNKGYFDFLLFWFMLADHSQAKSKWTAGLRWASRRRPTNTQLDNTSSPAVPRLTDTRRCAFAAMQKQTDKSTTR